VLPVSKKIRLAKQKIDTLRRHQLLIDGGELILAGSADGAGPVFRKIIKRGARGDA